MQEFELDLTSFVSKGIRNAAYSRRNTPGLQVCDGLRIREEGVRMHPTFVFTEGVGKLAISRGFLYLFNASGLSVYAPDLTTFVSVPIYSIGTDAVTTVVPVGTWHIAHNSGGELTATDGTTWLYRFGDRWYASTLAVASVAYNVGRTILAGFPNGPWTETFVELLEELGADAPDFSEIGSGTVFWGSVGSFDFPYWLDYPKSGAYRPNKERLLSAAKQNEFGWFSLPVSEAITGVAGADTAIVVFTERVTFLSTFVPASGDTPVTYSDPVAAGPGLLSRQAFCETPFGVLYIDFRRNLRLLQANGTNNLLGFEQLLSSGTWWLSYNVSDEEAYLSNDTRRYVLQITGEGVYMSGKKEPVYSTAAMPEGVIAAGFESSDVTAQVVTNVFDLRTTAMKALTSVGVLGEFPDCDVTVSTLTSYDTHAPLQTARVGVRINKEGNASIRTAGSAFAIKLDFSEASNAYFERLLVRYQGQDLRFKRGPSAGTLPSGTGDEELA